MEIDKLIEKLNLLKETMAAEEGDEMTRKRDADEFIEAKYRITTKINEIKDIIAKRNELTARAGNRRLIIDLNYQIRKQIDEVVSGFGQLKEILDNDLKKRKNKYTEEEKKVRVALVEDLLKQIEDLRKSSSQTVSGFDRETESELNPFTESTFQIQDNQDDPLNAQKDNLFSGANNNLPSLTKYKGGDVISTNDVELTDQQKQGLAMIEQNDQEIDQMVLVIGDGLDVLKDIALKMNDEIQLQGKKLDQLDEHMVKNQNILDKNTKTLTDTLQKAKNEDKFCFTLILIALIVGLGLIIYNWVK